VHEGMRVIAQDNLLAVNSE